MRLTHTFLLASSIAFTIATPDPACTFRRKKNCKGKASKYCSSILLSTAPTTTVFADNACITGGTPPNKRAIDSGNNLVERDAALPGCFRDLTGDMQYTSACSCLGYTASTTTPTATATAFLVQADYNNNYAAPAEDYPFFRFTGTADQPGDPFRLDDTFSCALEDLNIGSVSTSAQEPRVQVHDATGSVLECTMDRDTGLLTCANDQPSVPTVLDDPQAGDSTWYMGDGTFGTVTDLYAIPYIAP